MIKLLEIFNTLTAPIGLLLTIYTFRVAFITRGKLEEAQEVSLFHQENDYYLGQMEAIKALIDNIDDRQSAIPEKIFVQLYKLMSKFESNFPYLTKHNKLIAEPLNKYKEIKNEREVKYADFVDIFNDLESMFSNRKDLK
jgi:hypothetical protein